MSIYQLIEAIKANDELIMQKFYLDNFIQVKKFVLHNKGSIEEAKDIYQEAYLSVWRNIKMDRFNPKHDGALEAYLFRIARNKWLDHLRSLHFKKTTKLESKHDTEELSEELDELSLERIRIMKDCFRQLDPSCHKVLSLFYYKKTSLKLIAEEMKWTEATAKNNKFRCMEKLRKMMK